MTDYKCYTCGTTDLLLFYTSNKTKCKICTNIKKKLYYQNNKEKIIEKSKFYYKNNREKILNIRKKHNKTIKKYKRSKESILKKKEYEKSKKYKEKRNFKLREKYKNDIFFKIKAILRSTLYKSIKRDKKCDQSFNLIGCTPREFKLYMEKQFDNTMSWENHGLKTWHIDHIIPIYTFDLTKEEEQKKCFHYTNMRPLSAKENIKRYHEEKTLKKE